MSADNLLETEANMLPVKTEYKPDSVETISKLYETAEPSNLISVQQSTLIYLTKTK